MSAYELTKTILKDSANLKAYYRFESGALATDSGPNGYTLTNNNTVGEGTGVYGGGADFSASNTNKRFSIASNLGVTAAYTFSYWVKLNAEISSSVWYFSEQYDDTSDTANSIIYDYNGGTRRLTFDRYRFTANVSQSFSFNVTLGTSSWNHIAATFDGTTLRGYLNGKHIGSVNASANGSGTNSNSFTLGASGGSSFFSSILMDDCAVFNTALSADQIKELYEGRYIGEWMPQTNLVGLWHLNGNSTDSSGNNNHGTDTAITYSLANGKFGQGAGFNGSTSKIATSVSSIAGGSFTVLSWVNITSFSTQNTIFAQGNTGDNDPIISIATVNSTTMELINRNDTAVGLVKNATTPTLSTGVWYFVAWTCSTTQSNLYINANVVDTTTFTANTGTFNTQNIGIRQRIASDGPMNGKIDEVAIFSRVLTAAEIRKWYAWSSGRYI